MDVIQFTASIGPDGLIHPPEGVVLPEGEFEVSVRSQMKEADVDSKRPTLQWLLDLADEAEADRPNLPSDMAENHDHYAHGAPKR